MARSSYRIERINEIIKEVLSELVLNQISDPRVGLVTIVGVRVAADLSVAKVHYSVMGDQAARENTQRGLMSARNFMRRVIGEELGIKNAPELRFVYDDSLERSIRIAEVLKETGTGESAEKRDDKDGESK